MSNMSAGYRVIRFVRRVTHAAGARGAITRRLAWKSPERGKTVSWTYHSWQEQQEQGDMVSVWGVCKIGWSWALSVDWKAWFELG